LLGELGFENAYAAGDAAKNVPSNLGIRSIADLASHARCLSMAGDYEILFTPDMAGLQKAYGLAFFRAQRQMADIMYARRSSSGEVDVIAGYTSDGLIAKSSGGC